MKRLATVGMVILAGGILYVAWYATDEGWVERLRGTITDTGPGIHHNVRGDPGRGDQRRAESGISTGMLDRSRRTTSTGVGLANIRDRLAQAYGDDHRFEIRSPDSGGFAVMIEIPFESAEDAAASPSYPPQARQAVSPPKFAALPSEKASPA